MITYDNEFSYNYVVTNGNDIFKWRDYDDHKCKGGVLTIL